MIPNTTDIFIVGSGVSGFAAALAAAKENKNVILIEKNSALGGDSTQTNVGTICGAYFRSFAGKATFVGYSFCKDILTELQLHCSAAKPTLYHEGLYIIPYEWSALQHFMKLKLAEHNVTVLSNTEIVSVEHDERKIQGVTIQIASQKFNIEVKSIIDCSGNGIVSTLTNFNILRDESYQAASQIFRVKDIETENEFTLNMSIKRLMSKMMEENNWPQSYRTFSAVPGSLRNTKVDLKLILPETITDSIEENKIIQTKSHQRIQEIFPHLQHHIKSFKNASIDCLFPSLGIRVLQRSKGKYILTEHDVLSCKKSNEGIALGTWPIEEWSYDGAVHMHYFDPDKGYDIPADCLISDEISNLYFAGKNISATSRAIASARVIGTSLQTGYAAGKLACSMNEAQRMEIINTLYRELHSV